MLDIRINLCYNGGVMKIWFVCHDCRKYHWLPATPELINYYDGMGDDCSYCPTCDEERTTSMRIGSKPQLPILLFA